MLCRNSIVVLILGGLLLASLCAAQPLPSSQTVAADPVGLIIKFKAGVDINDRVAAFSATKTGRSEIDKLNTRFSVERFERAIPATLAERKADHPFKQVFFMAPEEKGDLAAAKAAYERMPNVERVEYDYPVELLTQPNDSLYANQWALRNVGQSHLYVVSVPGDSNDYQSTRTGTSGADIHESQVFDDPPDTMSPVVVAVIDCGVDVTHPELTGHIWVNPEEVASNDIDDDNNGFVDDVNGWHFGIGYDGAVDSNDLTDTLGHGTHIAGIIAAATNNSVGVAGICPTAKIMSLRFNTGYISNAVRAIIYATDNGADVVNMSWRAFGGRNVTMEEALEYAKSRGTVLVASSGNDGKDYLRYPAASPYVISVGACTPSNTITYFSTWSSMIDLVAPGDNILSLRGTGTDMYGKPESGEPNVHIVATDYYLASGTSMAGPHVAGAAAYLKAVSPGIKPDKVQTILQQSATDFVDPLGNSGNYPGWDKYSGYGRINLDSALALAVPLRARLTGPPRFSLMVGTYNITGIAGGANFRNYIVDVYPGWDPNPSSTTILANSRTRQETETTLAQWDCRLLTAGFYTMRLRVCSTTDTNTAMITSFVIDGNSNADITSPTANQQCKYKVAIVGSAQNLFKEYFVEFRNIDSNSNYELLKHSTLPVAYDTLAIWVVDTLVPGNYRIRLTDVDMWDYEWFDSVSVVVVPSTSPDWAVTLPGHGGMVVNYGKFDDGLGYEIVVGTTDGLRFYNDDGTTDSLPGLGVISSGNFTTPVAIGAINGDSKDDILAFESTTNTLYQFLSTGNSYTMSSIPVGRDLEGTQSGNEGTMSSTMLADGDNDGSNEMYVVQNYGLSSATFQYDGTDTLFSDSIGNLCIADVDTSSTGNEVFYYHMNNHQIRQTSGFGGTIVDSFTLHMPSGNDSCHFQGLTAVDIDGDETRELICMAGAAGDGYCIWAFDEGLTLKSGWPHFLGGFRDALNSMPVFGDIDGDDELDYVVTTHDAYESCVFAWHIDGSSMIEDANPPGLLVHEQDMMFDLPILADVSGDGVADVIAGSHASFGAQVMGGSNGRWPQRLWAWQSDGTLITDFPIMLGIPSMSGGDYFSVRYTPLVNDIDRDGHTDLVMPTNTDGIKFFEWTDVPFERCSAPATGWRYHRNRDNAGLSTWGECLPYICGDVDSSLVIDSLDVEYLSAYLWADGPAPRPLESAELDCVSPTGMGDFTYLCAYVFQGGAPLCDCIGPGPKYDPATLAAFSFATSTDGEFTTIELNTPIDLRGVELVIRGGSSPVNELETLEMVNGLGSERSALAFLDLKGKQVLKAGRHQLVSLKGALEIVEVNVVDMNNSTINVGLGRVSTLPTAFALDQNYPNPFNPSTEIAFALPMASDVKLEVFNMLGQRVASLVDAPMEAGYHTVTWNAGRNASGVYLYRLSAGDFVSSRKMLMLK